MADGERFVAGEPLEEFLNTAPCGLLVTAPDGLILGANDTFFQWTGYERAALVGSRRLDHLFSLPSRIYYETHYAPLLRIQGFAHEVAVDIVQADGTTLPVFVNAVEKRSAEGRVELIRIAVFAARDRRTYERELLLSLRNSEEAVKAKADFLAMFAHEVRNPLSAVALQVGMLERGGVPTPAQFEKIVARLRRSLDRVLGLLNSMLDISKLDAGKVTIEETAFDLADVLQSVVHTMGPLAEQKRLPVEVRIDPAIAGRMCGDPVKLGQALTNLVGNAIKFTESGAVTVRASQVHAANDTPKVRFSVQDTGIGVPAERQARIFDEYEQGDASVGRRFGGTGLGLAITRKLVELQGGRLTLESEPGRGSTFAFEIPL